MTDGTSPSQGHEAVITIRVLFYDGNTEGTNPDEYAAALKQSAVDGMLGEHPGLSVIDEVTCEPLHRTV